MPKGVILHGSRSVVNRSVHDEFIGTANYAHFSPLGLGWNATIGPDEIALHMPHDAWGWNARGCSQLYLAVEFAQAHVTDPIDDGQVRAFCWFFGEARKRWPNLPAYFPTHAELDGTVEYGGYHDGKTDVFPKSSQDTTDLRVRIHARLTRQGVSK